MTAYLGKTPVAFTVAGGSAGGGGDEIEVINNTGRTIEVGDKVWVNNLSDNADGSLQYSSYNAQFEGNGFTKDGQYLFAGFSLYKVNADNNLTEIKRYNANSPISIKHFNGKTYAIASNFTACINYPNNWDVNYALINDGYFVNSNSTEIRKCDLDNGELIKTYTGDRTTSSSKTIVIDNVMYHLDSGRRKYTFNDDDNTYSARDYVVTINNTDNKEIGTFLGKTSDGKYYIDSNLNLIRYLGNDTFEVVANEKMPAILQRWNGMNKSVNFNQDTGILVVDEIESSGINEGRYGIYRYHNGEWQKLNFELNRNVSDRMTGDMTVNYDLTKYAFTTSNGNSYRVNVGTMQPNLKVMAQEFRWFNVNERTITGVAKENAEPDAKFKVSTVLEAEIDVTVTTNADNAYISMEL